MDFAIHTEVTQSGIISSILFLLLSLVGAFLLFRQLNPRPGPEQRSAPPFLYGKKLETSFLTCRRNAQFGPLGHEDHKYISSFQGGEIHDPILEKPAHRYLIANYLDLAFMIGRGRVQDFFGKIFYREKYRHLRVQRGYAPLNNKFSNFYICRVKRLLDDCFAHLVTGVPGRYITIFDRESHNGNETFLYSGALTETLNLSLYNYLGFAQSEGPCADAVEAGIKKYGTSLASTRSDAGTSELHVEAEHLIAEFVGQPAAAVFSMGFGINAAIFPALVGPRCLVISDELNHASIRFGVKLSGASIATFKHNDMKELEIRLREAIAGGQQYKATRGLDPTSARALIETSPPWNKILVVVEGLYSMEGTMVNLTSIMELKRRYKFSLFIDEAHSIGALGSRGRGVCDYFGVDPTEVDILMGTFTKSFGASGGYIAGQKSVINGLRTLNTGSVFRESPTTPVLCQIISSLKIIIGRISPGEGMERLQRIAFNSRYLRLGLKRLGFIVYGHDDSPIIPLLIFSMTKIRLFSREMLKRKIAVVVVGYLATLLLTSRARFCVSAAHTKDDLDRVLVACDEVGDILGIKFSRGNSRESFLTLTKVGGFNSSQRKLRWELEDIIKISIAEVSGSLQ